MKTNPNCSYVAVEKSISYKECRTAVGENINGKMNDDFLRSLEDQVQDSGGPAHRDITVPAVAEVGKAVLSFEAIFQASLQWREFFKRTVVTLLDLRRSGMVELAMVDMGHKKKFFTSLMV
jgi:hypothetical protein